MKKNRCRCSKMHTLSEARIKKPDFDWNANIRNDNFTKRIKIIRNTGFSYHMTNECYKKYTLQEGLYKVQTGQVEESRKESDVGYNYQKSSLLGPSHLMIPVSHHILYVVTGHLKQLGTKEKFCIAETDWAAKVLEATVNLQDEINICTCDLQGIHAVFGAGLCYHNNCMRQYMWKYEKYLQSEQPQREVPLKQKVWNEAGLGSSTVLGLGTWT